MSSALRHPRFARLLAALAVSQLGDWLYNLALLAYVEQRTHSVTWLAATTAARVLPIVVAGPLGGVVADRCDRRVVMIASDLVRAGAMAALTAVAVLGLPVVLAPALAALATLASAPYPPSVAATTPRLVPAEDLPAANAVRAALGPACIAAGPALGALLLLAGPPALAFGLNAATFAVSALLVVSIRGGAAFRPERRGAAPSLVADLRAGAAALGARRDACRLVAADVACSVVYGAQTVLLVRVAQRLGLGVDGYGYLLAAVGAGGLLGAPAAARLLGARSERAVIGLALVGVGVSLALLAVTSSVAVAVGLGVVGGFGSLVVEVAVETGLQRSLPEELLGRAYGFAFPAAIGGIAAGSLVAAPLAALAGVGGALALLGFAVVTVAALLVRAPRPAPRPAVATA